MGANLINGELYLTGYVGSDVFEDCFDVVSVLYAIAPLKPADDLTVRLNSPGGSASEGAAIHALMTGRPGRVDIVVEGIAASAASLIAMAGETVTMGRGAVLMIHDPSGFTQGTSKDHSKTIEGLEALATAYAGVYAAKSGKTVKACREIMQEERWYSPEEAVAAGFADEIASSGKATMAAAFDYTAFAHAPQTLVALAIEKKWTASKPSSTKTPSRKEPAMSKDAVHATATARLKAILKAPEAEGRSELAEHLAYDTAMSAVDAVALMAKAPQASAAEEETEVEFVPRRLNATGLNRPLASGRSQATARADLAANMKRRHGIK